MEKYLGKKVTINGVKKNTYNCLECGDSLILDDYIFGDGRCASCRSKFYDRNITKYIDIGGNNQIDEILLKKRERR